MIGSTNSLQDFEQAVALRRSIKTANDVQTILDFQEANIRETQSRSFKGWPYGSSRKFQFDKQYMKSFQKLSLQEKITEYAVGVRFLNRLVNSKRIDMPAAPTQDSYNYNGFVRPKGIFKRWQKSEIQVRTRECSITTNIGNFDLHEYFIRRGNNKTKSSLVLQPMRSGSGKRIRIGFDSPIVFQNCQNILKILAARAHSQNYMRMTGDTYDMFNGTSSVQVPPFVGTSYVSQSPNPIKNIVDSKIAMMQPVNNSPANQIDRMVASKAMTLGQSNFRQPQNVVMPSPIALQGSIVNQQNAMIRQSQTNQMLPATAYRPPELPVRPNISVIEQGDYKLMVPPDVSQFPNVNGQRMPEPPQGALLLAQKAASYNSNIRPQSPVANFQMPRPEMAPHNVNPISSAIRDRPPSLIPSSVQPNENPRPQLLKKHSTLDEFAPPEIMVSKIGVSRLNNSKLNKTIVNELIDQDSDEDVMQKIETQNNIAQNIDHIEEFGRKQSVSKQDIEEIKHKKDYDIFHCIMPQYKLSQLEDLTDYKVLRTGPMYTIYESISRKKNFKLVLTLNHPRLKVVEAMIDPNNYRYWNDEVDIGNIKLRIYSENTVIAYQKHKAINISYRERDFLYVRHLFKENNIIYMVDKSIEHSNYPQFDYITRGTIHTALWSFKEIDRNTTQLTYMQEVDIRGLMRGSKVTDLNVKYLEKMCKLNDFLNSEQKGSIKTRIEDYFDLDWDIGRSEPPHYKQGPSILYRTALPETPWNQEQFMSFEMANRGSDQDDFEPELKRDNSLIDSLQNDAFGPNFKVARKDSLTKLLQKDSLKSVGSQIPIRVTGPTSTDPDTKSPAEFHKQLVNAYMRKNSPLQNKGIPEQFVYKTSLIRPPISPANDPRRPPNQQSLPTIVENTGPSASQSLKSSKGVFPQSTPINGSQFLSSNSQSRFGVSQPTNIHTPSDLTVQFQQSNPTQIREYHNIVGNQSSIEKIHTPQNGVIRPPINHQNMVVGLNSLIAPIQGNAPPTIPLPPPNKAPAFIPQANQPKIPAVVPPNIPSSPKTPAFIQNGSLPIESHADNAMRKMPVLSQPKPNGMQSKNNLKLPPPSEVCSSEDLDEPEIKNPSQIHELKEVPIKVDPVTGLTILPKTYLTVKHLTKPYPAPFVEMTGPGWKNYFLKDIWSVHPDGHLNFINEEKLKEQHKTMSYILTKFAKNLLSGKSILNISLPVNIFSDLSILELTVRGFGFAPVFLEKAASISNPLERFKATIVFFIAYTNLYLEIEKPFNPILGETFQGWVRGCPVYAEQISHHPAITAFYMVGNGYKIYGSIEPKVEFHLNSATGSNDGQYIIEFDRFPRNKIKCRAAGGQVAGLTYGQRKVTPAGKAFYYDEEGHFLELTYNPYKKGLLSFSKQSKPSDWVEGNIVKIQPEFMSKFRTMTKREGPGKKQIQQTIAKVDGRFTESIKIDGRQAYNVLMDKPCALDQEKYPLNSNSNYREDIVYKRKRDLARAQVEKERLEVKQREDKKLREKSGKSGH